MSIEIFGIKNCDKVRAAKKWLDAENVIYTFQDIRDKAVTHEQWMDWLAHLGWEKLINKRSTTWKSLDKKSVTSLDNNTACSLLEMNPTLMKRPLLVINGQAELLGFNNSEYEELLVK